MTWAEFPIPLQAVLVACVPATCMLSGAIVGMLLKEVNVHLQAALQVFSGGIIIAAVGGELFPLLLSGPYDRHSEIPPKPSGMGTLGLALGFLAALLAFYILESIMDKLEGGGEEVATIAADVDASSRAKNDSNHGKGDRSHGKGDSSHGKVDHSHGKGDHSHGKFERGDVSAHSPAPSPPTSTTEGKITPAAHVQDSLPTPTTEAQNTLPALTTVVVHDDHPIQGKSPTRNFAENSKFVLEINRLISHLLEHIDRQQPLRYTLDKHTHQLEHQLDGLRCALRDDPDAIPTTQLVPLKAALLEIQEQAQLLKNHQSVKDFEELIAQIENSIHEAHAIYEVWRPPKSFRRWSFIVPPPENAALPETLPLGIIFAVALDTFVDGFLIALAYVAAPKAGFVMAGATCIEMGFLGLTFSAQLRSTSRSVLKWGPIVILTPFLMPLGSLAGSELANFVVDYPAVFIAFIAFSAVALLFLVTQELLIEAHNSTEKWWVHVWFFIGVLVPLIVSRHLD